MPKAQSRAHRWSATEILKSQVEAQDGPVGNLADLLFDDRQWFIKWLVVDSGAWLLSRRVLLPPSSAHPLNEGQILTVGLSRAQVKSSPEVWADPPVSEQRTADIQAYYSGIGYGLVAAPYMGIVVPPLRQDGASSRGDAHLRSAKEVIGYGVTGKGTQFGRVKDLGLDLATWRVASLLVERDGHSENRSLTVPPEAVQKISWESRSVELCVTEEFLERSSSLLRSVT